jgi:competence protein ComEC
MPARRRSPAIPVAIRSLSATAGRATVAARRHPRHLALAALVAGLLLGPVGPGALLPAALVAVVIGGPSRLAPAAVVALVAGALVADLRLAALDAGPLAGMSGRSLTARVTLLEPVRERAVGPAVARVRLLDGPAAGEQAVLRLSPAAYKGPWPEVGDELRVSGFVGPLGRFDGYQRRRNAHAALTATHAVATRRRRGGVAGALDSVRRRAEAGLASGLAPPEAALLRGMVLGEDERLSGPVRTDFQRAGLAHILAVSGQNVMLLVALILAAAAATGLPLRPRLALAIGAIALYVPLAGGGPSIQRAGVMGVAGIVAALAGQPARRWYALGLAAAVTLAINPRAAGEPGWQLSFAAVAALLVGAGPLRLALAARMPRPVAEAAAITIAATAGTAPLMALYFEQVSLASLPANLLAAVAIAPIMWLGMLAAAAAQIAPALALPFTAAAAPLLVFVEWVAHAAAAAPGAVVAVHAAPPALLAGSAAIALALAVALRLRRRWAASPRRTGRRPRRAALAAGGLAAVLALAVGVRATAAPVPRPAPGELVVSFLDIGQGDATLIQLGGAAILVDTGPPDGPILSRLAEAHVGRLDALVLTHAQADHEGAALAVMQAHPPRIVVDGGAGWSSVVQRALPRALAADHAREVTPYAGEAIAVGGMRLRILWPPVAPAGWRPEGDPNDRAVVARLEAGGFSMLLTADAESDVTAPLQLAPVDVLKVAHHGSDDPGLPALLKRLHPRVAAIEVGRRNRYGHPAPSTLAALRGVVPDVIRTDRDGTVRLHALGGRMWLER